MGPSKIDILTDAIAADGIHQDASLCFFSPERSSPKSC
jgi:hypothetical protein